MASNSAEQPSDSKRRNTMKNIIIAIIMLALTAISATALVDVNYKFNVNNAQVEAYNCVDAACSQVTTFSGSFPNGKITTTGQLTIRYPSTLANPNGYAIIYVSNGFIPQAYKATWHSNGDPALYSTSFNIDFTKIANCRSVIDEFTVTNDAQANVPLVIGMTASLDATTHSAFRLTNNPVKYVPPQFKGDHYSADTRVTLRIYESNGGLVRVDAQEFTNAAGNALFADESRRVEFSWTPSLDGRYTAVITTEVIDNQCASATPMSSSKEFSVLGALPRNECYTLLNDLQMDTIRPVIGQAVTATYSKTSNHANAAGALTAVPTRVTETVRDSAGATVFTQTRLLGTNTNNFNPTTHAFTWTAPRQDSYVVSVTGQAESALCNGLRNTAEIVSTDVYARNPSTFTVTFQLRDSITGLPIPGASVTVNGQTVISDANGRAILGPFAPGTYAYTITHPGYNTASGNVAVTDFDLNVFLTLSPRIGQGSSTVTVNVQDAVTNRPIANAAVAVDGYSGVTDATGVVRFLNFIDGTYAIRVSAAGFDVFTSTVTINGNTNILVRLVPSSSGSAGGSGSGTDDDERVSIHVSQIRIHDAFEQHGGNHVPVTFTFKNNGDKDVERLKAAVVVPDLALRDSDGPMDLDAGDEVTITMFVDLPADIEPGLYPVRVTLYSLDKQRVVHREIEVLA